MQETRVWFLGQKDSLEKEWQPTPIFLPGESPGQRSLAGYSPWGCKESDTTEQLTHTVRYSSIIICFLGTKPSLFIVQVSCPLLCFVSSFPRYWVTFFFFLRLICMSFMGKKPQNSGYVLFCLIMCVTDIIFSVACLLQNSLSCVFWKTSCRFYFSLWLIF